MWLSGDVLSGASLSTFWELLHCSYGGEQGVGSWGSVGALLIQLCDQLRKIASLGAQTPLQLHPKRVHQAACCKASPGSRKSQISVGPLPAFSLPSQQGSSFSCGVHTHSSLPPRLHALPPAPGAAQPGAATSYPRHRTFEMAHMACATRALAFPGACTSLRSPACATRPRPCGSRRRWVGGGRFDCDASMPLQTAGEGTN